MLMSGETRRGHWILLKYSHRWLRDVQCGWALRTDPRSSAEAFTVALAPGDPMHSEPPLQALCYI